MNTETKYTENTLMVRLVDGANIADLLNILMPLQNGDVYSIDSFGLVANVALSNECIYTVIPKVYRDGELKNIYDISVRVKRKTDKGYSISMVTDFYFPMTLEEIEANAGAPVSLREFMGQRYNYNPRIKTNMKEFLQDVGNQI